MARVKIEGTENKFYQVEVNYQLGGTNYFSGKNEPRGIYISFGKVEVGDHFVRSEPFSDSSYKILFKELKRKSAKQIETAEKFVNDNLDEIIAMYKENDKKGLFDFIYQKG